MVVDVDRRAVRRTWAGCRAAADRYEEARCGCDEDIAFAATFEVLNWIAALDEALGQPEGPPELGALRFVRNRVHHQLADALTTTDVSGRILPAR